MNIITGKIVSAKKTVVYGPEGIGKSTFAARFPKPLFIDTEGSTKDMDVSRFEKPSSWTMLLEQVKYTRQHPDICKTLVVDTIDWAEAMCVEHICEKHQKGGIESFGYGTGYVYVREEFGRFLNLLEDVINAGINVTLLAHAQLRKFEQPDEMGAYDRWELKLGKKTASQISPLVKEWADMLLFANYKTFSVAVDDKGKKHKAQGGKRVMYTSHHPCWDAKNRYGLPDEVPFDYAEIAHIIESGTAGSTVQVSSAREEQQPTVTYPEQESRQETLNFQQPKVQEQPRNTAAETTQKTVQDIPLTIPKALRDLMIQNNVGVWDIQNVVCARGYYPADTPIENYDPDFINGVLVGAWTQVYAMIQEIRDKEEIPFN